MKTSLVVENDIRIWRYVSERLGQDIPACFMPPGGGNGCISQGYVVFGDNLLSLYFTGDLDTAMDIIREQHFDRYFLDNQVFSSVLGRMVFGQDIMIEEILKSSKRIIHDDGQNEPEILSISTHENTGQYGRYIARRIPKTGKYIIEAAGEMV